MIVRVIKVLEISRGCWASNRGGGRDGCGLARNSSMYKVRELLSSKQAGLVYRWLNGKTPILSLPGTFVVSTGKHFCSVGLGGYRCIRPRQEVPENLEGK